jgi:outer membrane protease
VATPVFAADDIVYEAPGHNLVLRAGFGYSWIEGNELVFDGVGNRISHLIWETEAPVFTIGAEAKLGAAWKIMANGAFGFSGNSHMEDYDWIAPFNPSYAFNDWSHQSIHPDTRLDRYIDLDIAIGRDFVVSDATTFNLHGGFKYTNIKWSAYGGSFIYSTAGFRDTVGTFPAGVPGISYEQRFPGVFLGAEATTRHGAWTFSGLLRGGVTIGAETIDHHWMRDLRFDDHFGTIPFVSIGAKVDYQFSTNASLFLAGNLDRYFRAKGDTTIYDIPSGVQVGGPLTNGAGTDLTAIRLSVGFKVTF